MDLVRLTDPINTPAGTDTSSNISDGESSAEDTFEGASTWMIYAQEDRTTKFGKGQSRGRHDDIPKKGPTSPCPQWRPSLEDNTWLARRNATAASSHDCAASSGYASDPRGRSPEVPEKKKKKATRGCRGKTISLRRQERKLYVENEGLTRQCKCRPWKSHSEGCPHKQTTDMMAISPEELRQLQGASATFVIEEVRGQARLIYQAPLQDTGPWIEEYVPGHAKRRKRARAHRPPRYTPTSENTTLTGEIPPHVTDSVLNEETLPVDVFKRPDGVEQTYSPEPIRDAFLEEFPDSRGRLNMGPNMPWIFDVPLEEALADTEWHCMMVEVLSLTKKFFKYDHHCQGRPRQKQHKNCGRHGEMAIDYSKTGIRYRSYLVGRAAKVCRFLVTGMPPV